MSSVPLFILRSPSNSFLHFPYRNYFDHLLKCPVGPSQTQASQFQNTHIMQVGLVTQSVIRNNCGLHNWHDLVNVCNISKQIIWNWVVPRRAAMIDMTVCFAIRHGGNVAHTSRWLELLWHFQDQGPARSRRNGIVESFQLWNCVSIKCAEARCWVKITYCSEWLSNFQASV